MPPAPGSKAPVRAAREGKSRAITCVASGPGWIAVGALDGDVHAIDPGTLKPVRAFKVPDGKGHKDAVVAISFSKMAGLMAVATQSGGLSIWSSEDVGTRAGSLVCSRAVPSPLADACFHPWLGGGAVLITMTSTGEARAWGVGKGEVKESPLLLPCDLLGTERAFYATEIPYMASPRAQGARRIVLHEKFNACAVMTRRGRDALTPKSAPGTHQLITCLDDYTRPYAALPMHDAPGGADAVLLVDAGGVVVVWDLAERREAARGRALSLDSHMVAHCVWCKDASLALLFAPAGPGGACVCEAVGLAASPSPPSSAPLDPFRDGLPLIEGDSHLIAFLAPDGLSVVVLPAPSSPAALQGWARGLPAPLVPPVLLKPPAAGGGWSRMFAPRSARGHAVFFDGRGRELRGGGGGGGEWGWLAIAPSRRRIVLEEGEWLRSLAFDEEGADAHGRFCVVTSRRVMVVSSAADGRWEIRERRERGARGCAWVGGAPLFTTDAQVWRIGHISVW